MSKGQWALVVLAVVGVAWLLYFVVGDREPLLSDDPAGTGESDSLLEADKEQAGQPAVLKGAGRGPAEVPGEVLPPPAPVDLRLVHREQDLHGVVVRADDTPVAGATLQAVHYPWRHGRLLTDGQYRAERPGPSTRSATDGTFALRLRRGDHVHLRAAADGLAPVEVGMLQAGEFLRVVLHAPVRLTVQALTPRGEPAPGLTLEVSRRSSGGSGFHRTGTTDAEGRCLFADLPPGGSVRLDAMPSREGWGDPGVISVPLPPTGEVTHELQLPEGRTLRGTVTDKTTGDPIPGARVGMNWTLSQETKTDAEGRYALHAWSGKGIQDLHVVAEGYGREQRVVGEREVLDFELLPGVRVEGRVLRPEGEPYDGAQVLVVGETYGGSDERLSMDHACTDAEGRFVLNGLRRDLGHVLTIIARGYAQHLGDVPAQADGRAVDLGDVVLRPARTLLGTLRGKDKKPLPRILINLRIVEADRTGYRRGRAWERTTDDLGRFRFEDLPAGTYTVATRPEGGAGISRQTKVLDRDEPTVVDLVQALGRAVRIRVTDADGRPVSDVLLMAQVPRGQRVQAQTDSDGVATLRLPPAPTRVQLVLYGEKPYAQPGPITVGPAQIEAAFVLQPAATTTGTLFDPAGKPLARASVWAERDGKKVAYARTAAEGRFEIQTEVGVVFSIVFDGQVWAEKGRRVDSLSMEARREGVRAGSVDVDLRARAAEEGGSLRVRVLDPEGAPVEGAYVFLNPPPRKGGARPTDAEGRVAFEGLALRRTRVRTTFRASRARPWLMPKVEGTMPEGQEIVLRMRKGAAIGGTVLRADGTLAVNAAISAEVGGRSVGRGGTDRDGRFVVVVEPDLVGPVTLRSVHRARDGTTYAAVVEDVGPGDTDVVLQWKHTE